MTIRIEGVSKKYQNENEMILDDINLNFNKGEFVSIVGESGSGKSTLLNIIGGLDLFYSGNVYINDELLTKENVSDYRRNNIGFIFQSFNLIPNLTAYENVLIKANMIKNNHKKRIVELFKELEIEKIMNKYPNELSGGQKQRVAIIRSLINDPEIILADEPTGSLDENNSKIIIDILEKLSKKGKLIIMVTHSNEISKRTSRIIEIKNKKVIKDKVLKNTHIKDEKIIKKDIKPSFVNLLFIPFKNIKNNIKRNLLMIFAYSIGIFFVSFMFFLNIGVKKYVNKEISNVYNTKEIEVNKSDGIKEDYFYDSDLKKINNIEHIKNIKKNVYINDLSYINYNDERFDLVNLNTFNKIEKNEIKYGDIPKDNEIIINEKVENEIGLNKGKIVGKIVDVYIMDTINSKIINKKLKISGVLKNTNNAFVDNYMIGYISYDTLNDIYTDNDIKLNINSLVLEVDDIKNVENVKNSIKKIGYFHSKTSKMIDKVLDYVDIITFILISIASISLFVSSIMIVIIMYINVLERTKEIGILRSLGFKIKDIKYIFLVESSLIGLLSGIYGVMFSSLFSKIVNIYTNNSFKTEFLSVDFKFIILSILISTLISTVSGLSPSIKASKLNIIDSLRYE